MTARATIFSDRCGDQDRPSLTGSLGFNAYDEKITGSAGTVTDTWKTCSIERVTETGARVPAIAITDFSVGISRIAGLSFGSSGETFVGDMGELWGAMSIGRQPRSDLVARHFSGNDTILGNAEANWPAAGAGDDRRVGGGGADTVDGGPGRDTRVHTGARADHLLSRRSDGRVEVLTRDGTSDRLIDVEALEFFDGTVSTAALNHLPGMTPVPIGAVQPVHRFYNARDQAFFYTTSVAERDRIIRESTDPTFNPGNGVWPCIYQGATVEAAHTSAGSVPVFRFYNPTLDRHFFSGSAEEAAQIRLTGQWNDEGIAYRGGEVLG